MKLLNTLGLAALAVFPLIACSGTDSTPPAELGGAANPTGGAAAQGGQRSGGATSGSGGASAVAATGGAPALGGSSATGGSSSVNPTGGAAPSGGSAPAATGGKSASTGGTPSTGGSKATGGSTNATNPTGGKSATGGVTSTGGSKAATGGSATGGAPATGGSKATTGGTPSTGGTKATGGAATGGSATGGSTSCDWSDPPSNVSAWINESWNAQLGPNIKGRQDWLIDNAMKGKGQINLCVRWGATTAPTAAVKTGVAAAVQKWFNDWFSQLNGYGCFPYPTLTVKVTGWAVKPGNTSWVSDLDSSIKIYTETDGEGEPKCPDACSFFNNWTHTFPNCSGGEAFHTDYWMWLDDSVDGAEAVGGDWGLRMPVSGFVRAMTQGAAYDLNTVEHEMGHGFGFQDYYDWTGSKPAGGSLMIIENPLPSSPTIADRWLLRRTWKEMKTIRGW